ncbi:MAG: hypothetical protein KDD11_23015 [Acidobacteria bacterium]|nr:hypothetical protein [Acidobacteriota bacterium]
MADHEQRKVWEVHDRYGNRIRLTAERWNHVLENRSWMAEHFEDVLATVREGRRKQDPLDPSKYKYYRPWNVLLPEYNHLVVVVRFREGLDAQGRNVPQNFVVTAWAIYRYGGS